MVLFFFQQHHTLLEPSYNYAEPDLFPFLILHTEGVGSSS